MNGKYECNTRRLSVGVEMKFETGKELPLTSRSNMIENEASSIAKAKATRKSFDCKALHICKADNDIRNQSVSKSVNMSKLAVIKPREASSQAKFSSSKHSGAASIARKSGEPISTDRTAQVKRYRAEVYAINRFLQQVEYANFENAKKERPITSPGVDDDNWNDDVSEASDQSTIIPTPRYELSGKSSAPHYVSGGMGNKCDKKNSTKVVKRPLFGGV